VTASVTNTGSEAVKVLNFGTILDAGRPSQSFTIAKNGKEAQFTGIKVAIPSLSIMDITHSFSVPA
jgi:deuterolysin